MIRTFQLLYIISIHVHSCSVHSCIFSIAIVHSCLFQGFASQFFVPAAFWETFDHFLLPAMSSVARQMCPAEFYVDRMLAITSGILLAAAVSGATHRWIMDTLSISP